ncbi:hypothetical protein INS49_005601 [Diaporthe citri]|uniref:uncharacterized protein n=1 Tax=Diaporthe citri TaxID=83186 RepID=UPI001C7F97D5|nr:uncharacterized protein INS49_005601 [Diaporthe citri]KAG6353420.1 hypothetical protein INS49_005601 [Diaporthe citri]
MSHSGWYLGHSFLKFADVNRYADLFAEVAAAIIEPADVVEALRRVNGWRMSVEEATEGPPTQDCATPVFETNLPKDSLVKLPKVWGECKDGLFPVDRLGINQRCKQRKAKQIPRMSEVYQEGASQTTFLTNGHSTKAQLFQIGRSRQVTDETMRVADQVPPARIVSDCLVSVDERAGARQICIASGNMESLGVYSFRCNISTWDQKISIGDLFDTGDRELSRYWLLPEVDTLASALSQTRRRTSSRPEDQVYNVLGMLPRGKELEVICDQPRNSVLARAANAGLVGAEILHSKSVSVRDGESWVANDDSSKHIGSIYDLGYKQRKPVEIHDTGLRTQFHRLEGVVGHYVDGFSWMLKLDGCEKEEIRCHLNQDGLETLVKSVDQILLLEEETRPG